MASLITESNGRRRIEFGPARDRRKVRLGLCSLKVANTLKDRIEELYTDVCLGKITDPETVKWLAGLSDEMHRRIAQAGLATPRTRSRATLKAFADEYLAERVDLKPASVAKIKTTITRMAEHFGTNRVMADIIEGDVDAFTMYLAGLGLSSNSVAKTLAIAKQIFRAAKRWHMIGENPFDGCKTTVVGSPDDNHFVTREEAAAVIEACPTNETKLIFALSRFCGLRTPSEHLALTWADVNFDKGTILVHSVKTERHPKHATRLIPLFPTVYPYLEAALLEAEDGETHVIRQYRTVSHWERFVHAAIAQAGLQPWGKAFNALRSSCEIELSDSYPAHVVARWMGHSLAVASGHYLKPIDEHFARAVKEPTPAARNAAHSVPVRTVTDQKSAGSDIEERAGFTGDSDADGLGPEEPTVIIGRFHLEV